MDHGSLFSENTGRRSSNIQLLSGLVGFRDFRDYPALMSSQMSSQLDHNPNLFSSRLSGEIGDKFRMRVCSWKEPSNCDQFNRNSDLDAFEKETLQKRSLPCEPYQNELCFPPSQAYETRSNNGEAGLNKDLFTRPNKNSLNFPTDDFRPNHLSVSPGQQAIFLMKSEAIQQRSSTSRQLKQQTSKGPRKGKLLNRNKNIIRDMCSKCTLYIQTNPRAMKIVLDWVSGDKTRLSQVNREVQALRQVYNFQGFRKFYQRHTPVVQFLRQLSNKFYDQEAFTYIYNSSIVYKAETIKQIGHLKSGLRNPHNFNQYLKCPARQT